MEKFFNSVREFIVNSGPQILINFIVFLVILLAGKIILSIITMILSIMLSKNERMTEIIKRFVLNLVNKAFWVVVLMIALPKLSIDVARSLLVSVLPVLLWVLPFGNHSQISPRVSCCS